jgi:hypothetical protein
MAEPLDEPLGVVARDELTDDPVRLGETLVEELDVVEHGAAYAGGVGQAAS